MPDRRAPAAMFAKRRGGRRKGLRHLRGLKVTVENVEW